MADEYVPDFKGYISVEHTIWCGKCSHWDQASGKVKDLVPMWRKMGWTMSREHGWRCPSCSKKVEG